MYMYLHVYGKHVYVWGSVWVRMYMYVDVYERECVYVCGCVSMWATICLSEHVLCLCGMCCVEQVIESG